MHVTAEEFVNDGESRSEVSPCLTMKPDQKHISNSGLCLFILFHIDNCTNSTSASISYKMDRKKKISDDKETIARDRRSERPQNLRRMSAARLRHDSINFNVPANEGAREYVKDAHGEDSWRNKVLHFLHSQRVQYTLMFLLFLVSDVE